LEKKTVTTTEKEWVGRGNGVRGSGEKGEKKKEKGDVLDGTKKGGAGLDESPSIMPEDHGNSKKTRTKNGETKQPTPVGNRFAA